jgi:Spy/CpxP family protein refolding chaperone
MSTKRTGIAAAALMLMTALSVTPTFAAADTSPRQTEDLHLSATLAGGGSVTDLESILSDIDLQGGDQVIANHKLKCSC